MSVADRTILKGHFLAEKVFITTRNNAARSLEKICLRKQIVWSSHSKEVIFLGEEILSACFSKGRYIRETGRAND